MQPPGDLGDRLSRAFQEAFSAGIDSVVVTASDVPALDAELVKLAFERLDHARGVIGPCRDGGYYLLGMRWPGAPLFESVAWGTDQVLEQTERLASDAGIVLLHMPELLDIDTSADLERWHSAVR